MTNAESSRPFNPYPDILTYNNDDDLYSQLVADIIEELEPKIHDLFPLVIIDEESGKEIRRDYHYLHLTNFVECVDEDNTVFEPEYRNIDNILIASKRPRPGYTPQVTLFEDAIKGHHIWRDPRYDITRFCSGKFKRRLEAEGIGGYRFSPCLIK